MVDFSTPGPGSWVADFTGPALVLCWGGGGGGGGGVGLLRGGSGGGGGSCAYSVLTVTNGLTYSFNVGAGGSPGVSGGAAATDGASTIFGSNQVVGHGGKAGGEEAGLGAKTGVGDNIAPGHAGQVYKTYDGGKGGKGALADGGEGGLGGKSSGGSSGGTGEIPGGGGGGGYQALGRSGGPGGSGMVRIVPAPAIEPGLVSIEYDAPGSYGWTAPADGHVVVECIASGGGARGGQLLGNGGAGAGGGAYSQSVVPVTRGTTYTIIVPSGGVGAGYGSSSTTNGADCSFSDGSTALVLAKGGLRSTGTTSGNGIGGQASSGIGDIRNSGDSGTTGSGSSQAGGNGGAGALPHGGAGGLGGRNHSTSPTNSGRPGEFPGGGGGGGAATNTTGNPGAGGSGADGLARIAYFHTLGNVIVAGEPKYIVGVRHRDGSVIRNCEPFVIKEGVKVPSATLRPDLTVTERTPPLYLPSGTESKFNVQTGVFNWAVGATKLTAAILANNFQFMMVGDSISEGWTYLNPLPPYNYTADFPNAFPRHARNYISEDRGIPIGGSGMVRSHSVNGGDPAWTSSGWGTSGVHFLNSTGTGQVATFTSRLPGTAVAVATSGAACEVYIDDVYVGDTDASITSIVTRKVFTGLPPTTHIVRVVSKSSTSGLYGADVYFPNVGVRVHNLAQGGSKAALGSSSSPNQSTWSDLAPGAPNAMTPLYNQQVGMFGRNLDAVVIMLGGNDSFQEIPAAQIAAAHDVIGSAFDTADTDIILMPDVHTEAQMAPLAQLCNNKGWGMVDFHWLSRGFATIFGQGYAGDPFGHLNVEGAKWAGGLLGRALLTSVNE